MNDRTYLYHYQVGFPTNLRRYEGVVELVYSEHAKREAAGDRYARRQPIVLPRRICFDKAKLVEAEALADGTMLKGVYRVKYNGLYDLVLAVVLREDGMAWVKTVWLNEKRDSHLSLRAYDYDRPKS